MNRKFSNNAKKVGCIISMACLTFSMTGCLNFLKKAKTTENYDAEYEYTYNAARQPFDTAKINFK